MSNEITKAAQLMGDAARVMSERESILQKIAAWAENNPYKVYGDYRDECGPDMVAALLESREKFDELYCEVEWNASDYAQWSCWEEECFEQFCDEVEEAWQLEECEGFDDWPEEVQESAIESRYVDCSDLLDTMLRNSSPRIAATILDPETGEPLSPPNEDCDEEENESRQARLAELFGIDGWKAESCYEHETLKAYGALDLCEVYEKGLPTHITVSPDIADNLVFHTGWNGSGGLGPIVPTKTLEVPVRLRLDDGDSYGIEAVYGLTNWCNELPVTKWEAWA